MTVYMEIGGDGKEYVVVETIHVFGSQEQVSELLIIQLILIIK